MIETYGGSPEAFRYVRGIDNLVKGVAISIKSLDINAKSYQNLNRLMSTISGYVQQLANYNGGQIPGRILTKKDIVSRVLHIVIPRGKLSSAQDQALRYLQEQAAREGVEIIYYQAR